MNASWSPDGKQVAWLSDKSGEYEIWISDAFGEELPRQLTSGDTQIWPEWSPDGKLIAWRPALPLYVTDVAKGITKKMITSEVNQIRDYSRVRTASGWHSRKPEKTKWLNKAVEC